MPPGLESVRRHPLRLVLGGVIGFLALMIVLFVTAWSLMPRDLIQQAARRHAERMSGATVRWQRLEPGFNHWALGVTVRNLELRMPAAGPAKLQARLPEAFIRFRLFPLFFRRIEVDGAHVTGGGVVMTDLGPQPISPEEAHTRRFRFYVPRVDLENVSFRTRDPLGTGYDLKRVSGHAEIDGTLDQPRGIRVDAKAESLYWKAEPRSPLLALPSPIEVKLTLEPRDRGKRLVVTDGKATLGPLVSAITGEVLVPGAPAPARLALRATGGPQTIRSSDPALRGLAAKSPASWSATAAWDIRIGGTSRDPSNEGRITLKPLGVSAQSNTFTMDQASATWTSASDRTFVGRAEGFGGGVTFTAEARGTARSGGGIEGTFYVRAPAERLNGLVANGPVWNTGELECRGTFVSRPPSGLGYEYTVTGTGFSGTLPGMARPVRRLAFAASGNRSQTKVSSLEAVVGSTTASITGQMQLGAVRTGAFEARLDRLVVEEWTLGSSGASLGSTDAGGRGGSGPLANIVIATHIGELRTRGLVVRNVSAPIRYAAGKLVADPIQGTIGGGSIQGALDMTGIGSHPAFTLHLDAKQVPVEELVSGFLPVRLPVSGTMNEIIDLHGSGIPGPQAANSMRGTVSGTLERGYLRQSAALKSLRTALGISSPPEVPYQTITHSARIAAGKLLLDKVTGDLGRDLFSMAGAVGFDQSLDLNALLRLAPERVEGGGFLAQLAHYAKDAEGRIPVDVKITGSALAPKVSVKPANLIQAAGSAFLKKQIEGLLPKTPADSARAAAESSGARPKKTAPKILERIFGGKAAPDTAEAKRDTSRAARSDSAANPIQKAFERLLGK